MKKTLGDQAGDEAGRNLSEFLDTAWRIVLPVTSLTLVGATVDAKIQSTPWFMLLCATASVLLSVFLVRLQGQDQP
jgi:hypothetical protein